MTVLLLFLVAWLAACCTWFFWTAWQQLALIARSLRRLERHARPVPWPPPGRIEATAHQEPPPEPSPPATRIDPGEAAGWHAVRDRLADDLVDDARRAGHGLTDIEARRMADQMLGSLL